jgi:mono/diheme cytochrome c family protein
MVRKAFAFALVLAGLLLACDSRRGNAKPSGAQGSASLSSSATVTPVTGPSWLQRRGLTMSQSKMGEMGGTRTPPAPPREQGGEGRSASFLLTGADLYRLSCQSCHGPAGSGSPPEISSLIGPVQGTSVAMIARRMQARGVEVDPDLERQLADEAERDLRDRLQNGGKAMPPFHYLRADEVDSLLAYLDQLAGVPAGPRPAPPVSEPAARVGELMVKGTCHICHDATGPGAGHMAMMRGVIPSLASLPQENSLDSLTRAVRYGPSEMMGGMGRMGMMSRMGGPQMPPFPYFNDQEIEAAYSYLQAYPPKP